MKKNNNMDSLNKEIERLKRLEQKINIEFSEANYRQHLALISRIDQTEKIKEFIEKEINNLIPFAELDKERMNDLRKELKQKIIGEQFWCPRCENNFDKTHECFKQDEN